MADLWWKDFFQGLIVDFWRAAIPQEVTDAEIEFLQKHLRLEPGSRVLDVPCGHGRHAVELAARGCRVTGVDFSEELLDAARGAAYERGLSIEWRRSDMRDLPWRAAFDAAYSTGSSFGYFDDEGNRGFLEAVARTLKPGGRFFADFKAAESILPNFRDGYVMEVAGVRFEAKNSYDPVGGVMENVYTITRGERTETKKALHRIYTVSEILRMLSEAGFGSFETFGSIGGEPYRLGSSNLLVVASTNV